MKVNNPLRWKVRASLVYALGTWTVFGGLAYNHYFGQPTEVSKEEEEREQQQDQELRQRQVVHVTPHSRSVLTYREDNFVFTTWLFGLVQNIFGGPRDE